MRIKIYTFLLLLLSCGILFVYLKTQGLLVTILFEDYKVQANPAVFAFLSVIFIYVIIFIIKIIEFPGKISKKIFSKIERKKEKKIFLQTLTASTKIIEGKKDNTYKILEDLSKRNISSAELKNYIYFLFAFLDLNFNTKLFYLQNIINLPEYRFSVAKELAITAFKNNSYHYSLEYALIAFDNSSEDSELIVLLIEIYAKLDSWDKLGEMLSILQNVDQDKFQQIQKDVTMYYFRAAKHFVGLGETKQSLFYLQKCLEYNPGYEDCVYLISNIYNTLITEVDIKSIIEKAFNENPSVGIFKVYLKHFEPILSNEEIYYNLSTLTKIEKDYKTKMMLTGYLNLEEELGSVKQQMKDAMKKNET